MGKVRIQTDACLVAWRIFGTGKIHDALRAAGTNTGKHGSHNTHNIGDDAHGCPTLGRHVVGNTIRATTTGQGDGTVRTVLTHAGKELIEFPVNPRPPDIGIGFSVQVERCRESA